MNLEQNNTETVNEQEQKLNRRQQRIVDRANAEANTMHKRLVNQFGEFFIDNDPDSDEVADKQEEVSAKWKMFCKNRGLLPEVLDLVNLSCNQIREQYKTALNGNPIPEGPAQVNS